MAATIPRRVKKEPLEKYIREVMLLSPTTAGMNIVRVLGR